jgi:hypothetical protein
MGKNKEKATLSGQTELNIMESLEIITLRVLGHIYGQTGENLQEIGKTIRCMEKAFLNGLMVEDMKEGM